MADKKSDAQTQKQLLQSLEVVASALEEFHGSLKQSGMIDGMSSYRELKTILMQQRMWARQHPSIKSKRLFQRIAKTSAELHRVFHAYAEVMKSLKQLNRLGAYKV